MSSGPIQITQASPLASYQAHRDEIDAVVSATLARGTYILGPETEAFEAEFAGFIGAAHAVGVASGTDALELALRAVGVRWGDAVITVSHTAVATVAAIERAGARPVLCDVHPDSMNMSPLELEAILADWQGPRIGAIVPVHLYGGPADIVAIARLAAAARIPVVEDCAQAHGATVEGRSVGTFGAAAAFSFYPTKNLGALGDGGAVVTNDRSVAEHVRRDRQYGWVTRYISESPGFNSRLDEIQAAVLRVKLRWLPEETSRRRAIAARYDRLLADAGSRSPASTPGHVYHQYVVRTSRRDETRAGLAAVGIGTGIHYPAAVHQQAAYRERIPMVRPLPQTERIVTSILSLPMHIGLSDADVDRVGGALADLVVPSAAH